MGSFGNYDYQENGYFSLSTPLTTDLDLISEHLFNLTTGGSEEYCGLAIQSTLDSLKWSDNKQDLRIIFIAGNELFNLGQVDYSKACKRATKKRIIINTIFCGAEQAGIKYFWADGAKKGNGKYLTINQDSMIKKTETIWDKKIISYNNKLNSTYVPYGKNGEMLKQRQVRQDKNALLLGNEFLRDRVVFKISESYQNAHWDLVDAFKRDHLIFNKMKVEDFPIHMRTMTDIKRKKYLEEKEMMRDLFKEGAQVYYDKAQEFLVISTGNTDKNLTLDNSIIDTIKEQGKDNGFKF